MNSDRARESAESLARANRDSGTFLDSAMKRASDHFTAQDALREGEGGTTDPIEVWGRRIGRALSLVLALFLTWLLGAQMGWW